MPPQRRCQSMGCHLCFRVYAKISTYIMSSNPHESYVRRDYPLLTDKKTDFHRESSEKPPFFIITKKVNWQVN